MNIVHVSKIDKLLSTNYEVIFVFHSEEALNALIDALRNSGVIWANENSMCRKNYKPREYSLPRAIRVNMGYASIGSIEIYKDNWKHLKQYRVVL